MTFRRTTCPHCRTKLEAGQRIHPACIDGWATAQEAKAQRAQAKKERAEAKVERAVTKQRKRALETIPELIAAAQKEFNAYIRLRDCRQLCICCDFALGAGEVGGAYDCGHYRSRGAASHLRFDERNAHAQRKYCNKYKAGNSVNYRAGLINRIGLAAVEALEADNTVHHWTKDELRAIRAEYRDKLKNLQKN